jgi:hypothetical protein
MKFYKQDSRCPDRDSKQEVSPEIVGSITFRPAGSVYGSINIPLHVV